MMRIINKTRKITMFCLVFCLFLIPNMVSAATENLSVSNVFPMETRYSQTFTPNRPDFKAILNVNSLSGLSSGSNLKVTIQKYNPSTGLFEDRGMFTSPPMGVTLFILQITGFFTALK